MIQFNLLPDVKLEFIKAERLKRLVISVATIASVVAIAILVVLVLIVDGLQKKNLNDLNRDIKVTSRNISGSQDLNKVLTIQNQLSVLTNLHNQKAAATRLFGDLAQVTPSNVTISSVDTDFTQNTMTITGNAPSIDAINTFIDTLKFTTYSSTATTSTSKAFNDVVLSSFTNSTSTAPASYTVMLNFDGAIFSNANAVTLTVPNTVTTRSVTGQPLFKSGGTQ